MEQSAEWASSREEAVIGEQIGVYSSQSRTGAANLLQNCIVVDRSGEEIGDVEDIIIDLANGQISHIVLSYGDWLSSKTIAIPWKALRADSTGLYLVLETDLSQLI